MKRTVAAVLLAAAAVTATPTVFAVPTVEAVQAEVVQGRYESAEAMMREVIAAKPRSARAHYVYAELLAHQGQLTQAASELQQAKQLDPQLRFTSADKLQDFERKLSAAQASTSAKPSLSAPQPLPSARTSPQPSATVAPERAAAHASSGSGLPGWVWGLGGMGIALVLWRVMSRRQNTERSDGFAQATAYPQPTSYGAGGGTGYAGQYPGPGYGAGPAAGSGLAKAGLAAAGGFAAGMLAERLLRDDDRDVDRGSIHSSGSGTESRASSGNDQGFVPGMFDDVSSPQQDLSNRGIDFGSGDGWGGGDADASGGGGSDDGW